MAKKFIGYILTGIGLAVFFFFYTYRGELIPLPMLWLVLSVGIVALGIYFTMTAVTKSQIKQFDELKAQVSRLKEHGERVSINLDECDFKTTNVYEQGAANNFSNIQMLDALYNSNLNQEKKGDIVTYILYRHKNGGNVEKFISPPFPFEETMLRFYLSDKKLMLYIDRDDRTKYVFDIL